MNKAMGDYVNYAANITVLANQVKGHMTVYRFVVAFGGGTSEGERGLFKDLQFLGFIGVHEFSKLTEVKWL